MAQGQLIENTSMKSLLSRLDTETYVFDLVEPIQQIKEMGACHFELRDPTTLEVSYHKEDFSLNQIFAFLNQQGLQVLSMRNKTNRLEQLFLDLVEGNKA